MCKEKEIKMVEIELDLDEKIINGLITHAKTNILKDKKALINWAVNDILLQIVETDGKCLKRRKENGKSKS